MLPSQGFCHFMGETLLHLGAGAEQLERADNGADSDDVCRRDVDHMHEAGKGKQVVCADRPELEVMKANEVEPIRHRIPVAKGRQLVGADARKQFVESQCHPARVRASNGSAGSIRKPR